MKRNQGTVQDSGCLPREHTGNILLWRKHEVHLTLTPSCIPSVAEQNFPLYLSTHTSLANSNNIFSQNFLLSPWGAQESTTPRRWATVWRPTAKMQGQPFKQLLPPTGQRPSSWASCFYFPDTWHWFPPFGSPFCFSCITYQNIKMAMNSSMFLTIIVLEVCTYHTRF